MRALWISGWALPKSYLETIAKKRFPSLDHTIIYPGQNWQQAFSHSTYDHVYAYSLGSFILRQNTPKELLDIPTTHFAPFNAFKKEANHGGKVTSTQLKFLVRWLNKSPMKAIDDFYKSANIQLPTTTNLPYSIEDLIWGINTLLNDEIHTEPNKTRQYFIGDNDSLLDSTVIVNEFKNCLTVKNGTHCCSSLNSFI